MKIREQLGKELLFFDGAMGTVLQSRGLQTGEIPETWNVLHPDVIKQIHKEYLLAGCNIIKANTFGVNTFKCKNLAYTVEELVTSGIGIVKNAMEEAASELSSQGKEVQPMYTALDIGSLGKLLKPLSPSARAIVGFRRYLYGITPDLRAMFRENILASSKDDLIRVKEDLVVKMSSASKATLGSRELFEREDSDFVLVNLPQA